MVNTMRLYQEYQLLSDVMNLWLVAFGCDGKSALKGLPTVVALTEGATNTVDLLECFLCFLDPALQSETELVQHTTDVALKGTSGPLSARRPHSKEEVGR